MSQLEDIGFGGYSEDVKPVTLGEYMGMVGDLGRGTASGVVGMPYTVARGLDDIFDIMLEQDLDNDASIVENMEPLRDFANYIQGDSEVADLSRQLIGENIAAIGGPATGLNMARTMGEYLMPNIAYDEAIRRGMSEKDATAISLATSAAFGFGRGQVSPTHTDIIEDRIIGDIDPRFGNPKRIGDAQRISDTEIRVDDRKVASDVPEIRLEDLEGRPFITSMSDRSAAGGDLLAVNGVELNQPQKLYGGQDFMFDNEGQVWASAEGPVNQILSLATDLKKETGLDPIYVPWRMAPTGVDFSAMTGRTGLAYAQANMNKRQKRDFNKMIKGFIPDWKGLDDPSSLDQFASAPDKIRKQIKNQMDVQFRNDGGLSYGQMRAAISDQGQQTAREGLLQNVGVIDLGRAERGQLSGHPDYPNSVAGEGLGRLAVADQIPATLIKKEGWSDKQGNWREIMDPLNPHHSDLRSLQMKPVGGVLTEQRLRGIMDLLGR